jgi:hypothetical protein
VSMQDPVPQAPSERSIIVRGAAIIMVGTILSRILGLVREQITSWLFGTGDAFAAFTIADNIHTMLFDLVISGMMQAALVPVLLAVDLETVGRGGRAVLPLPDLAAGIAGLVRLRREAVRYAQILSPPAASTRVATSVRRCVGPGSAALPRVRPG